MNRFAPLLKRISDRLNLPQPLKSRILLEMAGDLEELYVFYRKKGLSEQEAMQKAEEKIDANDETIRLLVQLNDTAFRKYLRSVVSYCSLPAKLNDTVFRKYLRWFLKTTLRLIEYSGLILLIASIFIVSFRTNYTNTSHFTWIVLSLAAAVACTAVLKFYKLYIKKDHTISRLHSGFPLILFLGGLSLLIGITGFFIELHIIAGILSDRNFTTYREFLILFRKCTELAVFSISIAGISALLWFVFTIKTIRIEQLEKTFLLSD